LNLELTNKQYATLVKSLAISNWVLSTISEDEEASMEDDFSLEEFEELEQHILSAIKNLVPMKWYSLIQMK
jgi:hypothetical protein